MSSQSKVSQNFSYDKEPPQDVILDADEPQGGDKFMKLVQPEKRNPKHFIDYDGAFGNYASLRKLSERLIQESIQKKG